MRKFNMPTPRRAVGVILGSFIGAAGAMTIIAAGGSAAFASAPPTVTLCSNPTSCVTGDPVLASVNIQSATAATLSGTPMTFGTSGVLPGNTVTGTETYSIGTNDAAGAYVTATWDDSMITASNVSSIVTEAGAGSGTSTGFAGGAEETINPGGVYNQGMLNVSTLSCSVNNGCNANSDIPWSDISVAPASGAGGTPATFAFSSTGGVDPTNTAIGQFNNNGTAGTGGGSTVATVANFTAPVNTESLTDTYSLSVPANQVAGIYAADLWYQVVSN